MFNEVAYKMDYEGFDYCFTGYSDWSEIEDEKFQELRAAYVKAMEDLRDYVLENTDEDFENEEY